MKFIPTRIPDVVLVQPDVFGDTRGFFMETWEAKKFKAGGIDQNFVQDNHSRSAQGILRGLHYQIEQPQGKLARVVVGEVFDVAVDLRKNSKTFGQWVGVHLSAENKNMLWVPAGFAHGFYVLSEWAEFLYKCTEFYAPQHERCIRWDDKELAIDWPLVQGKSPILSPKDETGSAFKDAEVYP
ncbi:MAG: dTDP-4-dehydrorhamnose 3,5-epimerase [Desulfobulbaceae bacterium]|nr:dTDP-4-dehydrorhamnose 3,5-epimerase [Desulfobulbaceae bacterium]